MLILSQYQQCYNYKKFSQNYAELVTYPSKTNPLNLIRGTIISVCKRVEDGHTWVILVNEKVNKVNA